jgi:hypothetical protein
MDQQRTPSGSENQTTAPTAEENTPTKKMRFAAPFEVLSPCRSRILTGTAMFAVLIGLIFLLAR